MTPSEAIGYSLSHATAITAIVSARISNGLRPSGSILPCINYFELPGTIRNNGIETATYSINCRAVDPKLAMSLARAVADLFHGISSTGTFGSISTFDVCRAYQDRAQGLIPETEEGCYNAPVDITICYASSSVT